MHSSGVGAFGAYYGPWNGIWLQSSQSRLAGHSFLRKFWAAGFGGIVRFSHGWIWMGLYHPGYALIVMSGWLAAFAGRGVWDVYMTKEVFGLYDGSSFSSVSR